MHLTLSLRPTLILLWKGRRWLGALWAMGGVVRGFWASRWVRALLALLFAGGCAAAVAATQDPARLGGILKVRFGGTHSETRIVVDLDRSTSAKVAAEAPDRIIVSLANVGAAGVLQGRGQGLVSAWTVENRTGGARLSLALAANAKVTRRFLLPPAD